MKISNLFLLLFLLSFNTTTHATTPATNNKCQDSFKPSSASEKNPNQAIKAIETSDLKTLKELIKNKEIDLQWEHPFNKSTLLHLAAQHSKKPGIIEALIQAGVKIDAQDLNGRTALHLAIEANNETATKTLIAANWLISMLKTNDGETALHMAIEAQKFVNTATRILEWQPRLT